MANRAAKEQNRSAKGRTGRRSFARRAKMGLEKKRTKTKLNDGTWDSPQGIERPRLGVR